jgi:hypothetical protein
MVKIDYDSPRAALEMPPMTMNEAAAALKVSRRWLQDFLQTIPPCWLAAGNRKLFDAHAMTKIKEAMRCPSSSVNPVRAARKITRYVGPPSGICRLLLRSGSKKVALRFLSKIKTDIENGQLAPKGAISLTQAPAIKAPIPRRARMYSRLGSGPAR